RETALLGLGVAMLAVPDVLPWLDSGELARVLPGWWADAGALSLYYPGRKLLPGKTRSFIDFVVEAFEREDYARRFGGGVLGPRRTKDVYLGFSVCSAPLSLLRSSECGRKRPQCCLRQLPTKASTEFHPNTHWRLAHGANRARSRRDKNLGTSISAISRAEKMRAAPARVLPSKVSPRSIAPANAAKMGSNR